MKSASIGGVREGGTVQPRGSVTESDSEKYCDKDKLWKSVNGLEAARERPMSNEWRGSCPVRGACG